MINVDGKMVHCDSGILSSEIGSGKTVISLALASIKKDMMMQDLSIIHSKTLYDNCLFLPKELCDIIGGYTYEPNDQVCFNANKDSDGGQFSFHDDNHNYYENNFESTDEYFKGTLNIGFSEEKYINTTLVILPHYLMGQWENEIKTKTNLLYCKVNRKGDVISKEHFDAHDIVLVNANKYKVFHAEMADYTWLRMFIDEADIIKITSMPYTKAKFYWFITTTFERMCNIKHTGFIKRYFRSIFFYHDILMRSLNGGYTLELIDVLKKLVVRCNKIENIKVLTDDDYKTTEVCYKTNNDWIVNTFTLNNILGGQKNKILQLLSAGDNYSLARTVTKKMRIEFSTFHTKYRRSRPRVYPMDDYPFETALAQQSTIINDLDETMFNDGFSLERMIRTLIEFKAVQITALTSIISRNNTGREIHNKIFNEVQKLNKQREQMKQDLRSRKQVNVKKTKFEYAKDIIQNIVNSSDSKRVLIFTDIMKTYTDTAYYFKEENIKFLELKGNYHVINKRLRQYKSGEVKLMILNSKFFASGMNLPETTDIVMLNRMDVNTERQIIGRAKRIGRDDCSGLTVTKLRTVLENHMDFTLKTD